MIRIRQMSVMLLALLLLAACGQGGTTTQPTSATAPTSAPAATTAAPAAPTAATDAPTSAPATATDAPAATATTGDLPNLNGRKVVIGTDATYPPFESVDPTSNAIVGFDVDLMNEVAKLINIQPEFTNAAFDTIFTALQSKQYDAVMSAATITEERQKIVAFSDPYIEVGQLVVVASGNTAVTSYTDLPNVATVGVQTGTTGETATLEEAKVPDANVKRYQTIDLAFADLANGAIDAVVADGPTVGNYTSQPQYTDKLTVAGAPFTTESYGIAVQQGDTELLNAINAALAQLKENGTIDQLKEKHNIR